MKLFIIIIYIKLFIYFSNYMVYKKFINCFFFTLNVNKNFNKSLKIV